MGIPLKNLLKIGSLKECTVVAGYEGVNNDVENVTIMEVPDIVKWLSGKELLLTSLYPIKDDTEAQINLIKKLHQVGTTALAIKTVRFVEAIPNGMLKEADRYGITIIEIPEEVSYLDILSPVMNAIFNKKVILQEDLDNATRLLNEISNSRGGFTELVQTLSNLTKSKVFLESFVHYINAPNQEEILSPLTPNQIKELEIIKRPIQISRQNKGREEACIVAPISMDGELYGAVTCWGYQTEFMEVDLAIQEKASSLLALTFLRQKVKYDTEKQFKNDFIRNLLFNQELDNQNLIERGKYYHLNEKGCYYCLIIEEKESTKEDKWDRYLSQIESVTRQIDAEIIVGLVRESLLILMPKKENYLMQETRFVESLLFQIEKIVQVRLKIGVGSAYAGIVGIRKSFREAEKAITLGPRIWAKKPILYFEQLGVYRLISLIENNEDLIHYYNESIRKLVAYDQEYALDLTGTLMQYFNCNESLKDTASQLYIHVNTLKYRFKKIKQITGLSIHNSEDKLMLYIGLKVHRYFSVTIDKDKKYV